MNGKLILVIGMTGQGKSTVTKGLIAKRPHYIFDVNNEYAPHGFNCAELATGENGERFPDSKQFISDCFQLKNAVCVFEEATGFFKGRLSSEVDKLLVAKRHQQNDYIFVFHSIQSVPPQIYLLTNFVILMKTNDNPDVVKRKYPDLYQAFLKLKTAKQYSNVMIKIN